MCEREPTHSGAKETNRGPMTFQQLHVNTELRDAAKFTASAQILSGIREDSNHRLR